MRGLWIVLRKDLLRSVRSPVMVLVFLAFPILFSLLVGLAFGGRGEETMAPIRIALVDEDGGIVSRMASSALTQAKGPARFEVTPAERAAAMRMVEEDKVSAALCIPAGFSDSLLSGRSTHLEVIKNPAQSIYPGIVEEVARVLALLGGSASRILGEPAREIRDLAASGDQSPNDAFLSRISVAIGHRMRGVGRYAFPPAIRLEKTDPDAAEKKSTGSSPFTVALFVLPGMATFALLTLALAGMGDVRREETTGTLARQFTAPLRPWSVILGKALATLILGLACILVLSLAVAYWTRSGVSLAGFLALALAFSAAATGFATLLQSLFESERTGTALGSILVMVMAMVGGSFIPPEALPPFIRGIAPFTLNHWANDGFRKLLFESASLRDLLPNLAVLAGVGVGLGLAAAVLVRRRFLRGV